MAWCRKTGSPDAGTRPNQRRVAKRSSPRPITRRAIGLSPWKSYRSQASSSSDLSVDWMPATSSILKITYHRCRAGPLLRPAGVACAVAIGVFLAGVGRVGSAVVGVAAAVDVVDVGLDDGGEAERSGRPPQNVRQRLADLPRNGADAVDQGRAVGDVRHQVVVVVGVDAVGQPVAVGVGEAVVDQAVAVVVDAVADLGRGGPGGAGLGNPADTTVDGAQAGAEPQ